jgi:hypothetical protein
MRHKARSNGRIFNMRAPAKSIAKDLHKQRILARGPEQIEVSATTTVASSQMVVPGDGGVTEPVGARRIERSAVDYTDPMERFGGAGSSAED